MELVLGEKAHSDS